MLGALLYLIGFCKFKVQRSSFDSEVMNEVLKDNLQSDIKRCEEDANVELVTLNLSN
jgi:hypothetical protein